MRGEPLAILKQVRSLTDSILVGLSCGKDSLAVLDLCATHFRRVACWFMYTVPGLEFEERTLRYCERRYGVTVHRLPHYGLSWQLREWTFRGPLRGNDCPRLDLASVEDEARRVSGIPWLATGQRKDDSMSRRFMLTHLQGIDLKRRHAYPLGDWLRRDVYAYLRRQHFPLPPDHRLFGHSWGGQLYADDLRQIRESFPADYQKILAYFPYAEAQLVRDDSRRARDHARDADAHGEQVPGVPGADAAAGPDPRGTLQPAADRPGSP